MRNAIDNDDLGRGMLKGWSPERSQALDKIASDTLQESEMFRNVVDHKDENLRSASESAAPMCGDKYRLSV
jgi:hypothetical protein